MKRRLSLLSLFTAASVRPGRAIAPVAAAILLALVLAWLAMQPPAVVPATAPPTAFSAARAMDTVRAVSTAPHPSGSPAAASVRRTLAGRLTRQGGRPLILRGIGAGYSSGSKPAAQAGQVETLVAVLPGRDRTLPAIALMAHTDSVPGSFGAADDGFGVATALEVLRAIEAGDRPARDVILILTDGEEAGLLGARLFFADPARARRIGALINIDARGTSGLGTMFETGPGSGGLVARYRAVSRHRFAHSAATFLYERLPNRTDLTATKGLDIPALNFAFLDGEFDYHTPRDAITSVDPRTLQSLGDQILPVVRAVADDARPLARGRDGVFADAAPVIAVRYPAWVGWPLLGLAALLACIGLGSKAGLVPLATARAAVAPLAVALLAILSARLGYALTGVADDWGAHHRIMAAFGRYELALGLLAASCLLGGAALLRRGRGRRLALACLAAGIVAILLGRPVASTAVLASLAAVAAWFAFARAVEPRAVRAGTLLLGLVLSLLVQALAPALTPLVLWPTLAAAAGIVAIRVLAWGRWVAALLATLPLAYLLVFGHSVLLALGIPTPEAVGVFVLFAAPLVLPLAGEMALVVPGIGLLLGAALMLSIRATPATERFPALSQLYGVIDETGRSWLVSPLERPDRWTERILASGRRRPVRATMPLISSDPVWRVSSSAIAVAPPSIAAERRGEETRITVTPAQGGRTLTLTFETDRPLAAVRIAGRPLPGFADRAGTFKMRWQSPGEPVVVQFRKPADARVVITAAETTERQLSLPPRPPQVVAWLGSDRVIAMRRVTLR